MSRVRTRVGPWLVPVLVVVEVALVATGHLGLGAAVAIVVGVELLLAMTAIQRTAAAGRRFRAARHAGQDGWASAEDAVAELLPRRLARIILLEVRLWTCLFTWAAGRHRAQVPGSSATPVSCGCSPAY